MQGLPHSKLADAAVTRALIRTLSRAVALESAAAASMKRRRAGRWNKAPERCYFHTRPSKFFVLLSIGRGWRLCHSSVGHSNGSSKWISRADGYQLSNEADIQAEILANASSPDFREFALLERTHFL